MASLLDRITSFLTNPSFRRTPTSSPSLVNQAQTRLRQRVTAPGIGTPGGNQLFKTLSQSAPVKAAVQHVASQPLFQLPKTTPFSYGFDRSKSPTLGEYARGQLINPWNEGSKALGGDGALLDRVGGAMQMAGAGFAATPAGLAFNSATGLVSGAVRGARTGENLNASVNRAIANPTSLGSDGMGIENPALALGVDVVSSGPRGLVSGVRKLGALRSARKLDDVLMRGQALGITGVSPRANTIHPEDYSFMHEFNNQVRMLPRGANMTPAHPLLKQAQELAGHYFGRKWASADSATLNKLFDWGIDLYDHLPRDQRAALPDLPAAGLVSGVRTNAQTSARTHTRAGERVTQAFNTAKFNVDEAHQATLLNLQQALGLDTRPVRSFDDMREVADSLGVDPQKLLADITSGRITDGEVVALGDVIGQSSRRIANLTAQLKQMPGDSTLLQQLGIEEQLLNQAIRKRIKGGTEAGRAVAAFRIMANQTMDPAYWLDKAKRQIGNDKDLPADVVSAVTDLIGQNDRIGLARFISKLGESSGWEKAITLWKAGLLTGVKTTIANVVSNAAFAGLETVKDVPAAAFDAARATVTRSPRSKSVGLSNVTAQPAGFVEGSKRFVKLMRGEGDLDELGKAEIRRPIRFGKTRAGRVAQRYVETVFGIVGGTDKPFYQMAFRRSLADQGRVARMNGKLDSAAAGKLLQNPTPEMLAQATRDATYATFTNENDINDAIRAAKRAGGPKIAAAIDVIAPFTRTPTNVAKAAFYDYTPMGFVANVANKIFDRKSVTDRELADAFGRSVTGSALIWMGTELARRGLVTGASPSSEAERSQWELEGKRPNSVFINGQWHSVTRISPMGNLILLGAAAETSGNNPGQTLAAGVKGFSEASFLKGVSGGLQAVNQPERFGSSFIENTVAASVPTLSSDIARGLDGTQRDPEGLLERAQVRVPIAREDVPSKLTALGEELPQQGGFIGNLVNPFTSNTPSSDPLVKEFTRVGYNLNYTGDTIAKQGLSRQQEREYQRLAGQYIKQTLPPLIASSLYQRMTLDEQHDAIEKAVTSAKGQAREEIKQRLPTIGATPGQAHAAEEYTPTKAAKPLDLSRFATKRSGVAGLELERDRYATARKVVASDGYDAKQKREYFKQLGISAEDAEYDYLATREVRVKAQHLARELEGKSRAEIMDVLTVGRQESVSGATLVTEGVLKHLWEADVITETDYQTLRKNTGKGKGKTPTGKKGLGSTTKQQRALKTLATRLTRQTQARPATIGKRPNLRVQTRTLGVGRPRGLSTATRNPRGNAARVLSRTDVDALLREYAGR